MKSKENRVLIKRRLSGKILVFSWLFLLVIPGLILSYTLEKLFKITEETNSRIKQSKLAIEMEMFQKDVLISQYLDREIADFITSNKIENRLDSVTDLAADFKKKTGIEACAMITHGCDTAEITGLYYDQNLKNLISRIPKRLTLKYFISRNRQPFYNYVKTENARFSKAYRSESAWNKLIKDVDGFWQTHFGLIAELPFSANKTMQSVSSKLGGTVYFHYHPVLAGRKKAKKILGGLLFIVRGTKIPFRKILAGSLKATDTNLARSISFYPVAIDDTINVDLKHRLTFYSKDKSGVHLHSPIPESLSAHYIQRGSFYPVLLKRFSKNIPLLKVSIPASLLEHPLKKHYPAISLFIRLLCAISLIFALRIYFFGFEIRAGVRQKVIAGTLLVSFLPLTLLIASYQTWQEFDSRLLQVEIENTMKSNSGVIRKKMASFIHRIEKGSMDLAAEISKMPEATDSELRKFMQAWLNNSSGQDLHLDRPGKDALTVSNKANTCGFITSRDELFFRTMLAKININSGMFNTTMKDGAGDYSLLDNKFLDESTSGVLNSMLNNFGRLMDFQVFASLNSYSMAKVEWRSEGKLRYGSTTVRYNRQKIVRDFVADYMQNPHSLSEYNKFSLRTAFFTFDSLQSVNEVDCLTPGYDYRNLRKQLLLACQVSSSFIAEISGQAVFIDYVPRFPMIIVTTTNKLQQSQESFSFILLLGYGFVLIAFIFNLFGKIYLEPIEQLVYLADGVSRGNYDVQEEINTGDEFQELKQAFDSMLIGVIQKEKLMQFVSEDVVSAVKSTDDSALQPGGERLEATILFASIADFEARTASLNGNELMNLLDVFISAGDKIALATGGVLDKIIDDTLMLVYRARAKDDNHAIKACFAALQLRKELEEAGIIVKAGIATGTVLSGRIGSNKGKLDFTVIGDAVNMAARLKTCADLASETGILIATTTIRKTHGWARVRFVGRTPIKGKVREHSLYELVSLRKQEQ